jgi:limonene-1,2-epoxide hydrolase
MSDQMSNEMSNDAKAIATTYFEAWKAGDFDALRSILADEVTFRGPMGTADGMDECLQGLRGMSAMITDIVIHKIFVDGPDVLTWYDLHTSKADPMPTANWSHLEHGKIATIQAVFDARPLTQG